VQINVINIHLHYEEALAKEMGRIILKEWDEEGALF
jgi:hypothetical protein